MFLKYIAGKLYQTRPDMCCIFLLERRIHADLPPL